MSLLLHLFGIWLCLIALFLWAWHRWVYVWDGS